MAKTEKPAVSANESTSDRILSTALRLFNLQGVDRVPIYKIAAELQISPGNLTYHFARKQDIVYALISNLEAEAADALATPRNPHAPELGRYMVGLFRLMWRYHFVFESSYLAATDKQIAMSYQRIMKTAQRWSSQRIKDAIACGDIPPVLPPNSPEIMAENMWAVWVNRLGIRRPSSKDGDDVAAVYDCCLHHLSIVQPCASPRFIMRLHEAIRDMLGITEKKSASA